MRVNLSANCLIDKIMTNHHNVGMAEVIHANATCDATVIANFAWQHLRASVTFSNQVKKIESIHAGESFGDFFEDIRSYASASIMCANASIESLINELFMDPNLELRSKISNFENTFWGKIERKPILEKYQHAILLLERPLLDENSTNYKNVWVLNELRNFLVHYKPTWDAEKQRKIDLTNELNGKFQPSPFIPNNSDFITMRCMGFGLSKWAINSVFNFLHDFYDQTNLGQDKMAGFWTLEQKFQAIC